MAETEGFEPNAVTHFEFCYFPYRFEALMGEPLFAIVRGRLSNDMLKVGMGVGMIWITRPGVRPLARALNKFTIRKVAALKEPGRYSDGGGLYLRITPAGARSWVFMTAVGGKRVEIGLGAETAVGLSAARRLANQMREATVLGRNPRDVVEPHAPAKLILTFGEYADTYVASVESGWKSVTHREQWRHSLQHHAHNLRGMQISQISTEDVLEVLRPIWLRTPETASRVRARIERVLDAAKAQGHVSREAANPARMKGHLDYLLPKQSGLSRGHHKALPCRDVAHFMFDLRKREALAARCLEFTILTAARSGEALGAVWSEMDLKERLWHVPARRMKASIEHVVPLSDAAIELLNRVKTEFPGSDDAIFAVGGAQRSNMAMAMLLRRMAFGHITTHGFRSTFRDWAGDCTSYQREVIEAALAHTIQNKAERAYRRGTAIERRRQLMHDWAKYLSIIVEPTKPEATALA